MRIVLRAARWRQLAWFCTVALTCAVSLACGARSARAEETANLYQAVVPLRSSAEADRSAAFGDALRTVAVRISGDRNAGVRSEIAAAAANPARYVQQYAARSNHTLSVGFDPQTLEQLVLQAGLPLWPTERPGTLVLLFSPAVANGQRALLAGERAPERDEIEKISEQRGVRVTWPMSSISVGDASDPERLRAPEAAGTAARAGVLVGIAQGADYTWRYLDPVGDSATRRGSVAEGAHLVADTLAGQYALPSTRDIRRESIVVGGVADLGAYAAVISYLESLSLVRRVDVEEASGSSVRLGVTLRGDRLLLSRVVAIGGTLRTAEAQPDTAVTGFLYVP
jgi:hypothetical protein